MAGGGNGLLLVREAGRLGSVGGGGEGTDSGGWFLCEGFTLNPPHHFYDYAIKL